jgi:hypothetical protein
MIMLSDTDNENKKVSTCVDRKKQRFFPDTEPFQKLKIILKKNIIKWMRNVSLTSYSNRKVGMIGKNKMKDWRAAIRTWARSDRQQPKRQMQRLPVSCTHF